MAVYYDRTHGLVRTREPGCGAKVGDVVIAYGQGYEVVEIDDYGCYVCRSLNEDCLASDEFKTFDDLDIEQVKGPAVPFGEGI